MLSMLTWGGVPVYALCMGAAAVIALSALYFQMRRAGLPGRLWGLLSVCGVLLGYVCARAYYVLAVNVAGGYALHRLRFFSPYPYEYAMCGAALGVMLACVAAAAASREKPSRVLDAATLPMLLMLCLARASELFSDFGWGQVMTGTAGRFFPIAVTDLFGQWHGAVFFLEALCALFVLAWARRKPIGDGRRFATALLWFAVTQLVCESLRAETLRWGFVRVQQAQCAVFALVLLLRYARRTKAGAQALALRLTAFAACVGVIALMEYALDKLPLSNGVCYAVMAAAAGAIGLNVQRLIDAAGKKRAAP